MCTCTFCIVGFKVVCAFPYIYISCVCLSTGELIGVEYLYDQTGKVFEPPALDVDTPEPEDEVDDDGDEGFVEGCGCNISRGESTFRPAVRRARIVKSGSCVKQEPLAFYLMSGKRKVDYVAVINSIIELLPTPLAVRRVVLDFEAAMWEAVRDVDMLQHVKVKGCLFHHTQVINMARLYGTIILN